jgi:hypothetical protein
MKAISFNAEMTKAIIGNHKTETRRPINWQDIKRQTGCTKGKLAYSNLLDGWAVFGGNGDADICAVNCPFGKVGDILWVREPAQVLTTPSPRGNICIQYSADGHVEYIKYPSRLKWKPKALHGVPNGIFKEAARIFLKVTNTRIEKLQDIWGNEIAAKAEGVISPELGKINDTLHYSRLFRGLWGAIYKKKNTWDSNPFVWVIKFKRVRI